MIHLLHKWYSEGWIRHRAIGFQGLSTLERGRLHHPVRVCGCGKLQVYDLESEGWDDWEKVERGRLSNRLTELYKDRGAAASCAFFGEQPVVQS